MTELRPSRIQQLYNTELTLTYSELTAHALTRQKHGIAATTE